MPSDTPDAIIEGVAKGATKGILEWSEEKFRELVEKINAGDLAFIEDSKTIEIVRTQRETPEYQYAKKLITNPQLRVPIEMGLTLRKLEGDPAKLRNLKTKILKRYDKRGLHIAEIVQAGIFGKYVGLLIGKTENEAELKEKLETILKDTEKYVVFIKKDDDSELSRKQIANEIITRINAIRPPAIIVFSSGSAVSHATEIVNTVEINVRGYHRNLQIEPIENKDDLGEKFFKAYDFILKNDSA